MANANAAPGAPDARPEPGEGISQFIPGMVQFVKETWAELQRVQWPTQEQVTKHTVVVVSLVVFMAFYIGALDVSIQALFARLLNIHAG